MKRTFLLTGWLAAAATGAFAQADHAPVTLPVTVQEVTRAIPTPQDRELNDRVRRVLQEDPLVRRLLRGVQLKTVSGVVNLKGRVDTGADKRTIEDRVFATPGVVKIQNFILVSDIERSA